jgi:competence protein ComEA
VNLIRIQSRTTSQLEILNESNWQYQIDINQAGWVEWMQLPDIGETLSRRIVLDREQNGPFSSIEDVQRISGIGPLTMGKIRPHLRMSPAHESQKL